MTQRSWRLRAVVSASGPWRQAWGGSGTGCALWLGGGCMDHAARTAYAGAHRLVRSLGGIMQDVLSTFAIPDTNLLCLTRLRTLGTMR